MVRYSAVVWINRNGTVTEQQIENINPRNPPSNVARYRDAYDYAHARCREFGDIEYQFQIRRDDGHSWGKTSWYYKSGLHWKRRRDDSGTERVQQSPQLLN